MIIQTHSGDNNAIDVSEGEILNNTLLKAKFDYLKNILKESGGAVIAFSGGVDSTFLTQTAWDSLDGHCLAVLGDAPTLPRKELASALQWLKDKAIPYQVIAPDEYKRSSFRLNTRDRCFYCKLDLFSKIKQLAEQHGYATVMEGSNTADSKDFRPGRKALNQLGIISPMVQAGLSKDDIRTLAKEVYQAEWSNKPSTACLATRVPYGQPITVELLSKLEEIETFLIEQGFNIVRARWHKDLIRLEVGLKEMKRFEDPVFRATVTSRIKNLGFPYVALDLEGFRSGSGNELLAIKGDLLKDPQAKGDDHAS